MENKQIIGLFVHNHPGVLLRVTSLISRRGFNIDSLTVSPAGVEGYSRMTIRINGDDDQVDQFVNQIMKIVDVKKAEVIPEKNSVASELILIKVSTVGNNNNDILAVTSKYHASLMNIGEKSMTVSEIQKDILGTFDLSNQRVSAIVKQLVEDNSLVRTVVKRKPYFTKA